MSTSQMLLFFFLSRLLKVQDSLPHNAALQTYVLIKSSLFVIFLLFKRFCFLIKVCLAKAILLFYFRRVLIILSDTVA